MSKNKPIPLLKSDFQKDIRIKKKTNQNQTKLAFFFFFEGETKLAFN